MKKIFFSLLFFSLVAFFFLNFPAPIKVQGDGVFYYSWLRSAIFDHDLDFRNELVYFARDDYYSQKFVTENIVTSVGKTPNPYAYGTAILWLPFFAFGHLLTILFTSLPADGYSFFYVWMVNFSTWLYGIGALYFIIRSSFFIFEWEEKKENSFIWTVVLGIWLATPWLYYQLIAPSMSHIPALFLSSIFLFLALKSWHGQVINHWFLAVVIFLLCATRWQNVVLVLSLIPLFCRGRDGEKVLTDTIIRLSIAFVASLTLFVIGQMLIWKNIYGVYLLVPQGHSFIRSEFHGMYILFSSNHGLLLWSPFLILAFIGLPFLWKQSKVVSIVVAMAFVLTWLINGSLSDLGGGEAFGARRFLEVLPFLALPIIALLEKFKKYQLAICIIIGIFILGNAYLMEMYRLGVIPRSGEFDFWKYFIGVHSTF
jgi:hypothetical protein